MADVTREKHFLIRVPRDETLPVGEASVLQVGIDTDLVLLLLEGVRMALRYTETPVLPVIRSSIRNPIRFLRQAKQMVPQCFQRDLPAKRSAVVQYVKVRLPEIDDTLSGLVFYIRIPDVPFLRDDPVECRRSRRHLV